MGMQALHLKQWAQNFTGNMDFVWYWKEELFCKSVINNKEIKIGGTCSMKNGNVHYFWKGNLDTVS